MKGDVRALNGVTCTSCCFDGVLMLSLNEAGVHGVKGMEESVEERVEEGAM